MAAKNERGQIAQVNSKSLLFGLMLCISFLGIALFVGITFKPKPTSTDETPIQAWWSEELQRLKEIH
jgi:hypothetical protein